MRGSPGRRDEVVSSPAFNRKREELLGLLRSDQARGAAR